jgi:hypothetical protein
MMALSSQVELLTVMSVMNAVMRAEKDIEENDTEGTDSIVRTEEIRVIRNTAKGRSQPSGSLGREIASGQRATDRRMTALIRELTKGMVAHWPRS